MEKQNLGEELKQEGMEISIRHANQRVRNWSVSAFNILKRFLKEREGNFMAEDIRVFAHFKGLDEPPSKRAWGSLIVKAKKLGLIEFVRFSQVANPRAHKANASVWRKNEK